MHICQTILVLLLALGAASSAQQVVLSPATVDSTAGVWKPTALPNLELKVVSGDPSASGPTVVRLQAVREVRVPAHWHEAPMELTSLHGTIAFGMGDKFDPKILRLLPQGKSVTIETNRRHFLLFQAGAEVELRTQGPLMTEWVDPSLVKDLMKDVDSMSQRSKKKAADDQP